MLCEKRSLKEKKSIIYPGKRLPVGGAAASVDYLSDGEPSYVMYVLTTVHGGGTFEILERYFTISFYRRIPVYRIENIILLFYVD